MERHGLILANGSAPTKRLLQMARRCAETFVCADGGANTAARLGEKPDLILGDLDSVTQATLRVFRSVPIRRIPNQNSTDLDKALTFLIDRRFSSIDVLGGLGGRVDHLTGNLSALGKFSRRAKIRFVDKMGLLIPVRSLLTIKVQVGTIVSLIPLARCEGIVTSGLKWELKNGTLELGVRESTSNVVRSSPLSISVRRGTLLLFLSVHGRTAYPRA
ncbi:MAG: thiamine diphosphokinase [Ignavibacteriales bacterium]|nr:thiamine diphosphokinase [Ignavibacteriales bacterium]